MPKLLVRSVAAVAITLAIFAGTVVASGGPHAHGTADGAAAAGGAVAARARFHDAMRQLWEDHITWTRLVIVSAATLPDALPDLDPTVQRLLRNQDDIGDAIKPFYGDRRRRGTLAPAARAHHAGRRAHRRGEGR